VDKHASAILTVLEMMNIMILKYNDFN